MISYTLPDFVKLVFALCTGAVLGGEMTASIAELIADRVDAMPAGERRAAHTLVANYPLIGLKTVAEFSQAAGVSSPTILRFVARLGFQNYPEFQSALQDELAAQLQSPAARPLPSVAVAGEAAPLLAATLDNLRETFRHLSDRQIADIAARLADSHGHMYLVGGRFTDPLARYMAAHLAIIRPNVFHLVGQESLVHFAEKAHRRGVHIVLFTDQWLSPIARFARHVIAGRTAVPSPWDSSAALFVVAETLIGAVTRQLGADSTARLAEMERLR